MSGPLLEGDKASKRERVNARLSGSTLIVTNIGKLVGLGLAVNEAAIRDDVRNSVIAFCALVVLGAQVAENVVLRTIDRFFGQAG